MAKRKGGGGGSFGDVFDAMAAKMAALEAAADKAATAQTGALAPLAGMIDLFSRLSSIPVVGAFTPLLGAFSNLTAKLKAAGNEGLSFGASLSVMGGFVGAGIASFQNLAGAVQQFAGLLSPVSLEMFQRALHDTQATIGVALLPVLHMMTGVVREAGELMLPISRQLEPIFRRLADTMGTRLSLEMESLASVVEALVPLFDLLADVDALLLDVSKPVIEAFGSLGRLLAPVIRANVQAFEILMVPVALLAQEMSDAQRAISVFGEALAGAFGFNLDLGGALDGLKSEADRMREGFREMLRTLLLLSAAMAKLADSQFGDRYINRMLDRAAGPKREDTRGLRPAEGAHYVDSGQFGKDILLAGSMAGAGGGGRKTQEDLLNEGFKGVLGEMKGMSDLPSKIVKGLADELAKLPAAIVQLMLDRLPWPGKDLNPWRPGFERNNPVGGGFGGAGRR